MVGLVTFASGTAREKCSEEAGAKREPEAMAVLIMMKKISANLAWA